MTGLSLLERLAPETAPHADRAACLNSQRDGICDRCRQACPRQAISAEHRIMEKVPKLRRSPDLKWTRGALSVVQVNCRPSRVAGDTIGKSRDPQWAERQSRKDGIGMRLRHAVILVLMLLMLVPLGSLSLGMAAGPAPAPPMATPAELAASGNATDGQRLYASLCAGCHAPEAGLAAPHNTASFRARYPTDDSIALVVRSGRHPMPGFTPRELSDQSLASIIIYIRSLPTR